MRSREVLDMRFLKIGRRHSEITPQQHFASRCRDGGTGLPERLKARIETASGLKMDDVRVHHGSPIPTKVGAAACTRGADIYIGPGQERYLAHEAWHVVQQKQARVSVPASAEAVGINADPRLEREADVMGESVWRLPFISPLNRATSPPPIQPVVQCKMSFDPGIKAYVVKNRDYVFIGYDKQISYYIEFKELSKIRTVARNIWTEILKESKKRTNLRKIHEAEVGTAKKGYPPGLAPGDKQYEDERFAATKLHLVGQRAPGHALFAYLFMGKSEWKKEDLKEKMAIWHLQRKAWDGIKIYHPDNEDEEKTNTMRSENASTLYKKFPDKISNLFVQILLNEGDPLVKSSGADNDRSATPKGQIKVAAGDKKKLEMEDEYKKYSNGDLTVQEVRGKLDGVKGTEIHLGHIKGIYNTNASTRQRKSENFYIKGKAYSKQDIINKKNDRELRNSYAELMRKKPQKQIATTFSRKDRGKGQAVAMGGWSANAAIVASNILDNNRYNESLAWEWLHIRGAGIGGPTIPGNLTPGTYSANSEMIPIENKIKNTWNKPGISVNIEFEPQGVNGVFAKSIEMTIGIKPNGGSKRSGTWPICTERRIEFDKLHDKSLRKDLDTKLGEYSDGGSQNLNMGRQSGTVPNNIFGGASSPFNMINNQGQQPSLGVQPGTKKYKYYHQ